MVKRDELIDYLNNFLKIGDFDDLSVNGLQVEGKDNIEKIVLGTSVSERLFQAAVDDQADMIIVHHGAFWKNAPSPYILTGIHLKRMALLIKHDINLAAYHLPLDAHAEVGNNAQIMKRLEIESIKPAEVGFLGRLNKPIPLEIFTEKINNALHTNAQVFAFGSPEVQRVLVISGGSSRYYQLALANKADTFIGGDMKENVVRELEEVRLNFINAGHYNTEKFGVQALGKKLSQQFDLHCKFVDIPNPI